MCVSAALQVSLRVRALLSAVSQEWFYTGRLEKLRCVNATTMLGSFYNGSIRGLDTVELELRVVQNPHQKCGTRYVLGDTI